MLQTIFPLCNLSSCLCLPSHSHSNRVPADALMEFCNRGPVRSGFGAGSLVLVWNKLDLIAAHSFFPEKDELWTCAGCTNIIEGHNHKPRKADALQAVKDPKHNVRKQAGSLSTSKVAGVLPSLPRCRICNCSFADLLGPGLQRIVGGTLADTKPRTAHSMPAEKGQ